MAYKSSSVKMLIQCVYIIENGKDRNGTFSIIAIIQGKVRSTNSKKSLDLNLTLGSIIDNMESIQLC